MKLLAAATLLLRFVRAIVVSGLQTVAVILRAGRPGGTPPPLALLRGRHRRRLLLITPRAFPLSTTVRDWLAAAPQPASVRVQVDIDPQSFL